MGIGILDSVMQRLRWIIFVVGLLLAVTPPLVSVGLLMPIIPGAQEMDVVPVAYAVHTWRWAFFVIGGVGTTLGIIACWRHGRWYGRTLLVLLSLIGVAIHAMVATKMSAEAMFNEPFVVERVPLQTSALSDDGVMVVAHNGDVAVYSIDLLGHHHKILDTVGGKPVLVTYCTMCHTGRVFSPVIDGRVERFRLVGANYYNAMFEDETTGSWWYQATGECVAGPRTGMVLQDVPFEQLDLRDVPMRYADAMKRGTVSFFRRDAATGARANWAAGYSQKTGDTLDAMTPRTMVLGITAKGLDAAYPVRELCRRAHANVPFIDSVGGRIISITGSSCRGNGYVVTVDGTPARIYADAWHAWQTFHPKTSLRHVRQ